MKTFRINYRREVVQQMTCTVEANDEQEALEAFNLGDVADEEVIEEDTMGFDNVRISDESGSEEEVVFDDEDESEYSYDD